MNDLQAFLLGLIQGLTEFFPVSSSSHLYFAKKAMGLEQGAEMIYFDLFCHLGTLLAACSFLRAEILKIFASFRSFALLSLALLPLIPCYFLFKPLRTAPSDFSSLFLIITAALLFSASFSKKPNRSPNREAKWRDVLCIGVAQSLALLPGISRSGSTISTARLFGWSWEEAARFSFLLAVPAILGGTALELLQVHEVEIPWRACSVGFVTSFIVGIGAIRFLFRWLSPRMARLFAWYCLIIGIVSFLVMR